MNRKEFIDGLRDGLSGMPEHEMEERISFYNEMIDEHMANGESEETAIAAIGSVDAAVAQISSEIPLAKLVRDRVRPKKKVNVGLIILLVLGFPVWFPLALAALSIMFTVYLVIWVIILAFFIVDLALAIAAVATLPGAVIYLMSSNVPCAVFAIGVGLICAGLAVLIFQGSAAMGGWLLRQTGNVLLSIKKALIGKDDNSNENI